MKQAAEMLLTMGPRAVLVKGGHMPSPEVHDVLVTTEGMTEMQHPRVESSSTHGTGCTLASAIATGIAQGRGLRDSVSRARAYVVEAIRTAPGYGRGHGPLNHAHTVRPFDPA
jgi:hydroxymethylpyrimidine/phosphomethylpyrimidine kinase